MTEESMNLKNQQKLFSLQQREKKNNEDNEQSLRDQNNVQCTNMYVSRLPEETEKD